MTNFCVQRRAGNLWVDVHISCDKWKAERFMSLCEEFYSRGEFRIVSDDARKKEARK